MAYIVLVEDREEDIELTLRALRKASIEMDVVVWRNGVEALAFFESLWDGERLVKPVPIVVLLDINMPRMNGIELLERLRTLEHLRCVPIVMLTSSNETRDLIASYERGANSCVLKPIAFAEFSELIARLGAYWVATNELPSNPAPASP